MLALFGTKHSIKFSSMYLNHLLKLENSQSQPNFFCHKVTVSMPFNMFAHQTVDTQKCLDWTLKVNAKHFQ